MTTPDKWHMRHFLLAMHVATWSKDPTTQVGAVVVGADIRDLTVGYNGFPPNIADLPERYMNRQTKYLFAQHAERNALDNARFDCRGGTLATTMFPCVECAKSIISKGIKCLVSDAPPKPLPNGEKSWRDTVPVAIEMLEEAGVEIVIIGGPPLHPEPRTIFTEYDHECIPGN